MKNIISYIFESQEVEELQNKIKNLDKEKIFDGNYNLDDSLDPKFYDILVSLNSKRSSNKTLISTWKMLFSKLIIEPLVTKLIGENNCEISTIKQDRTEKWDIKYKNIYIDVKATYNNYTHNFGLDYQTCDFVTSNKDNKSRYILFVYPEIKNWKQSVEVYKNKNNVNMYLVSFDDLKEILQNEEFESKSNTTLIPISYITHSDKFRDFKKSKL